MNKIVRRMSMWGVFLILLMGMLSVTLPASAATSIVTGEVSGTWDLARSPYLIEGDIVVPAGEMLTIDPGVEVLFQGWYKLTVNGVLNAVGTESAPILFTATNKWLGIRYINAPDGSQLTHAIVENGQATGAAPDNLGGGIYIENSNPIISDSTIRNNSAKSAGGGLYLVNSNATLSNNLIVNNRAGTTGASAAGGGIYLLNSDATITSNQISGNSVYISGSYTTPSGLGGGIYSRSSNGTLSKNVISNNIVDANLNSNARGGGIYLYFSSPALVNNTITGNAITNASTGVYAVKEGGGVYVSQSSPVLVNTLLWGNAPQEVFIKASFTALPFTAAYSDIQGGQAGIVNDDNAPINWLSGNIDSDPLFVDAANGDYQLQAGSPAVDAGTDYFVWAGQLLVDLAPGDYSGNAPDMGAFEYGGAGGSNQPPTAVATAVPGSGSAPLTVQFNSDSSSDPDGFITTFAWDFGDGATSTAANPVHTYNSIGVYSAVLTVTDDDNASHSAVVSISVVDGTTLTGGNVSGTWDLAGSPYRIVGDITVATGETLIIEPGVEVLFQGWYKLTVNGVLDAVGTQSAPILFTATNKWLGIRFIDAQDGSQLTHAIVERGQATGASPDNLGGGIYIENASPIISHSTIRDNVAKSAGGGLYLINSNATITDNLIVNNRAGTTGASAAGGGIYLLNSDVTVTGNGISGNSVYISGSYSTPSGLGGGIYSRSSNGTFSRNVISDNTVDANLNSNARGGGIYLYGGSPVFVNNTITDNAISNASTGVYAVKEGGGIYALQSSPVFVNSILWNNAPQEVFIKVSGAALPFTAAYSDIQAGLAGIVNDDNAPINWLNGNIDSNPLFVDAVNGDYQLQAGSPAVDSGTDYFVWAGQLLVDLAPGEYSGNAPDMGALESAWTGGSVNQAPIANAGSDQTASGKATVYLDGSSSYDPDGHIQSYQWQQLSGPTVDLIDANTAVAQFKAPGVRRRTSVTLTFELTVVDDQGAVGIDTVTIVVSK